MNEVTHNRMGVLGLLLLSLSHSDAKPILCLLVSVVLKLNAVSFVTLTLNFVSSSLSLLIPASPNLSKLIERQWFTSLSMIILFFMLNHFSHSTIKNFHEPNKGLGHKEIGTSLSKTVMVSFL